MTRPRQRSLKWPLCYHHAPSWLALHAPGAFSLTSFPCCWQEHWFPCASRPLLLQFLNYKEVPFLHLLPTKFVFILLSPKSMLTSHETFSNMTSDWDWVLSIAFFFESEGEHWWLNPGPCHAKQTPLSYTPSLCTTLVWAYFLYLGALFWDSSELSDFIYICCFCLWLDYFMIFHSISIYKPGVVVHSYNPSTWRPEAARSCVWS